MDPLSIAASAAALAGTAGTLSIWLFDLIDKIKNVDTKLAGLCKEVEQLSKLLTSVEKTVKQCQTQVLTLAHLDQHMWEQIEKTLVDCKCNVDGLDRLVIKLSGEYDPEATGFSRLLKKPSLHFHFVVHKDEIQDYTNKIIKSNCAMQTTLAVVNVSLNFRTNVSQENIFQQLERLNNLVEQSLQTAAERREPAADLFSVRQSKNLESLARAAKRFHSAATTTASTTYGAGERRISMVFGGSEMGDLTEARRAEIERWTELNQLPTVDESTEDSMTEVSLSSGHRDTSTIITTPDVDAFQSSQTKPAERPTVLDDSDDDSDVELDFLRNFEELAYGRFISKDYSKAEKFLRMAVERSTGDVAGASDFKQLKMQLALCCCLQDKWNHAAGIIASLPKAKSTDNLPVLDLLQAITIANMADGHLEDAYNTCKTVLQGKRKVFGRESHEYYGCLWLLAAIHDKRGPEHALEAEAVRHSIPRGWAPASTESLTCPKRYILSQENLIRSIFSMKNGQESQPPVEQRSLDTQSVGNPEPEARSDFSGHWRTLLLKEPANGLWRAQREEMRGASIEETDTGKEFVVQSVPGITFDLLPDSRQTYNADRHDYDQNNLQQSVYENQANGKTNYSQEWLERRLGLPPQPVGVAQLPRPTSPKKHAYSRSEELTTPGLRSGLYLSNDSHLLPMRSVSQRVSSTQSFLLENTNGIIRSHSQQSRPVSRQNIAAVRSTPDLPSSYQDVRPEVNQRTESAPEYPLGHTKSVNRPVGHSRLIEKVQQAQARSESVRESPVKTTKPSEQRYPQHAYFENTVDSPAEDEYYSTLEVVTTSNTNASTSADTVPWSPTALLSPASSGPQLRRFRSNASMQSTESRRTRWTVQKDIGNIGEPRPFGPSGPSQFLPVSRSSSTSGRCFVSVSMSATSEGSIAVRTGQDEISICQMPARQTKREASVQSPTFGMRDFIRKANPYSGRKASPLTDTSEFTVDLSSPRDWLDDYGNFKDSQLIGDEKELLAEHDSATTRIEAEVASIMRRGQWTASSGTTASLRIEALVYALPDFLDRTSWESWTQILEQSSLLQHAKVIPQSYAIVQYYLGSRQLVLDHREHMPQRAIVVLNCDEKLVDCTPYILQAVSPELVEINHVKSSYMAEMAGHKHAQAQFARLVTDQLRLIERELHRKFDAATIDDIVQSCCDQFLANILPNFDSDGKEWSVEFEIPSPVPGFQHGRLKFTNSEVMRCFMQSVSMIKKMLEGTVLRLSHSGATVSHVLLAGSYSKSKYLLNHLKKTIHKLQIQRLGAINLLNTAECDDVCILGALSHAICC